MRGLVSREELEDEALSASNVCEEGSKHKGLHSHQLDQDVQGGACSTQQQRHHCQHRFTITIQSTKQPPRVDTACTAVWCSCSVSKNDEKQHNRDTALT